MNIYGGFPESLYSKVTRFYMGNVVVFSEPRGRRGEYVTEFFLKSHFTVKYVEKLTSIACVFPCMANALLFGCAWLLICDRSRGDVIFKGLL